MPLVPGPPAGVTPAGGSGGDQFAGLEPGKGAPLVSGPPRSVSGPIGAGKINAGFGICGILGILAVIVVVILVVILLVAVLSHK